MDLTLCKNDKCPKRKECFRFMAMSEDKFQSYSLFEHSGDDCAHFKPMPVKKIEVKKAVSKKKK